MKIGKRLFDLVCTIPGLIILAPALLMIALLIWLDDRGPIFYRQERIGKGGRPFRIWKFRSMIINADKKGKLITVGGDPRISRIGFWLRKLKLDEFPQLFNVITGEMSLVGPRPEVPYYVDFYTQDQRRVLELIPGITDNASIKYRHENDLLAYSLDPERTYINEIMPEKIRLNMEYASRANVWQDILVILNTLLKIFR